MVFPCNICDFSTHSALEMFNHTVETANLLDLWQCCLCPHYSDSQHNLMDHLHNSHPMFTRSLNEEILRLHQRDCLQNCMCPVCGLQFETRTIVNHHIQLTHTDFIEANNQEGEGVVSEIIELNEVENAHNRTVLKFKAQLTGREHDIVDVFKKAYRSVHQIITDQLNRMKGIKIWVQTRGQFNKNDEETTNNFCSYSHPVVNTAQIPNIYNLIKNVILVQIEEFTFLKSGWILDEITDFSLYLCKYRPIAGSTYIPTPPPIAGKKSIINIKNTDDKCFLYCVLAYLQLKKYGKDKHNHRIRTVTNLNILKNSMKTSKINDDGIIYPPTLYQIQQFERQNEDFSFTILMYENSEHHLIYSSETEKTNHVDLMVIEDDGKQHFVLLNTLSQFLYKKGRTIQVCRNCLQCFKSKRTLTNHKKWCSLQQVQETIMPEPNFFGEKPTVKFTKFEATLKAPFLGFADFETFSIKSDKMQKSKKREVLKKLKPSGFAWNFIGVDDKIAVKNSYLAKSDQDDVAMEFMRQIISATKELDERVKKFKMEAVKTMLFPEGGPEGEDENMCCICRHSLDSTRKPHHKLHRIVKHHAHYSPYSYIGLAHNFCNLLARSCAYYPIFMHNGGNFDYHFIITALSKLKKEGLISSVEIIPKTSEKFLTIIIDHKIKFVDSLNFTLQSLDKLVSSKSKDTFKITHEEFKEEIKEGADISLLIRKGVFPYSYVSSFKNFAEKNPPREAYLSDLTGQSISEDDYKLVENIYESFKITTIGEHQLIYNRSDVSLLSDCMIELRNHLFNNKDYGLDLAQYYSIPGLSLDSMLRMTKVEIELLTDCDMHVWVEAAIRGGYCGIQSLRAAAAQNKYLPNYDPSKPSFYINYIDSNNEYGKAMSLPLPISDFEWVPDKDVERDYNLALKIDDDSKTGFLLEIDAEFPEYLHDYFNCLPPMPYKRKVTEDEWSESFQIPLAEEIKHKSSKCSKLICDLHPKKSYILHHKTLQLYHSLGVKITAVHKMLKFTQRPFLKEYIECNTRHRNSSQNKLQKEFYKLMTNCIFGKMIEQTRDRQRINIVLTEKGSNLLNRKITFKRAVIIDEDCTLHIMNRMKTVLNKPILTGVAILEYAKFIIYDMHYNGIRKMYGDKATLLMTDTDSLMYLIETEDVYDDMFKNPFYFDLHKYEGIFQKFCRNENKEVLGKFKDEAANMVISKFIGLKPKMYTFQTYNPALGTFSEEMKTKGIGKSTHGSQLKITHFENAIEHNAQESVSMLSIQSRKHQVSIIKQTKQATNSFDDKRFYVDNVRSLAYGHKDCKLYE